MESLIKSIKLRFIRFGTLVMSGFAILTLRAPGVKLISYHIQTRFTRAAAVVCFLVLSAAEVSLGASIDFSYENYPASGDISGLEALSAAYVPLDQSRYGFAGAGYLIQDMPIGRFGENEHRLILMCADAASGKAANIRLLVVDEGGGRAKVAQSIKLGSGEAPHLSLPSTGAGDILFRVIRTGNNSEGSIYTVAGDTGKLTETVRIDRSFQKRMKLEVRGILLPGGVVEVSSKNPPLRERLNLYDALDALVEDEIYQPNGRPVPALANLTLERGGWEDERIYEEDGSVRAEVGMSLVTLSKKQVVDVTVVLSKDDGGRWGVSDMKFEPFMPYR
ncbi:MAG: hypothetical protein LBO21_09660 [Synergistaceae bacterium]|jgi:hypothetical protein|nr:hypothetical protein [Synergistaceae bacterium]